jgi:hypothetical protein
VALLFSPVDQEELKSPYPPRPRSAFLMLQLGAGAASVEQAMAAATRETLTEQNFTAVSADEVRRTSDFLHKIIELIRGCGFGIAIFSDRTPAKTLANIFFEIGVAAILGKPVQLVWSGRNPKGNAAPSDFIRTEWIRYVVGSETQLRRELRDAITQIEEAATYYRSIGDVAVEALEPDFELAFERYKQAVLISDDAPTRGRIVSIRDRLADIAQRRRGDDTDDLASHRRRLLQTINEFIGLLPPRA